MNKKLAILVACLAGVFTMSGQQCYGYNETVTHKDLTQNAVNASQVDTYLASRLLLSKGIDELVSGTSILDRIRDGSELEDKPMCRASNHFHNPLNSFSWDDSYMKDEPFLIRSFCYLTGWGTKRSDVVWATVFRAPVPGGLRVETSMNYFDWDMARDYYFKALTSPTAAERTENYAKTFQALGQVLHLLQDMAVPSHVRSDFKAHWIGALNLTGEPYEGYVQRRISNVGSLHAPIRPNFDGGVTLTKFWDTNVYDSVCNGDGKPRMVGRNLGLAEYTNANFISGSTAFTESKPCAEQYSFPHPRFDETEEYADYRNLPLRVRQAEDGITDVIRPLHIIDPPEGVEAGEVAERMVAKLRYLAYYSDPTNPAPPDYYERSFTSDDDDVHLDNARRLLPRAIGYSANLLDYFFRGQFADLNAQTPLVRTLSANTIALNFKNGSGEAMGSGEILIYQDSGEEGVSGAENTLIGPIAISPFNSLANEEPISFSNITVDVPPGKTIDKITFTIVFQGWLGLEDRAVVARRFKAPPPPELPSVINVGDNPHGMALTPNRDKLYVTNYSANTVSVISTAQRQVIATIPVGSGPMDVAIAGNRAFVSNERGNSVSVIDIASDTVEQTITGIPPWPEEMAVSPDGNYVYLAHWSSRPLTKINAATLAYDLIPSPLKPCQGIAIQGTSAYLTYYTFYWRQSVGVVNLNSQGLTATIPGPDLNWSAAISGSRLYVAHPQVNAVSAYDIANNTLIATLPVAGSPRGVAAGSDGRVYVARLLDDKVSVIDSSTNTLVQEIVAGDGAYDVVVDNQAGYLYVSNAFADTVSVIPLSGGAAPLMAMAGASMMSDATPTEASSLATVVLNDFPPDGRVLIDGEFPRGETLFETGREVLMTPGIHELLLACPGYLTKTIAVNGMPGDYLVEDGLLAAE